MNNIEILEDYIEALRKPKPFKYTNEQKAQAIENLIQENKELRIQISARETVVDKLTKENKELKNKCNELNFKYTAQWVDDNFIPKSKVKEKIEELEKDLKDFEEYWSKGPRRFKRQQSIDYYKLEALKELLKEGGKQ